MATVYSASVKVGNGLGWLGAKALLVAEKTLDAAGDVGAGVLDGTQDKFVAVRAIDVPKLEAQRLALAAIQAKRAIERAAPVAQLAAPMTSVAA